jgi:putative Mg2+ transporter-C (MgtC) family protein
VGTRCRADSATARSVPLTEFGIPVLEMAQRLGASLIVGALIGWERERKNKPAGLRTHMLVTLGSATFCLMAFEVGAALSERYGERGVDPMRVLQGVVGGIGFLGAGSIIQTKGQVQGVTTAAGVWMAGALGAACGVGAYVLAGMSAVLTLIVLAVLARVERRMPRDQLDDSVPASSKQ